MSTNQDSTPQFSQLLGHLMRGGAFGYWWTASEAKDPATGDAVEKLTTWHPAGTLRTSPLQADSGPHGARHVYFGVNPTTAIPQRTNKTTGKLIPQKFVRATLADVASINTLFAEFDAKDFTGGKPAALAHVHGLGNAPSVIIDSGGGYHCYWLLADPFIIATDADRQRARALQAAWVNHVGSDGGAKDLARVLRVPGTKNYKPEYGPDFPTVTIISADFARLYTVADLDMTTPAAVKPEHSAKPAQPIALDDQAIKDKAMSAGNSAKFAALWRGDITGYKSASEADQALCNLIAFWTRDASQIERLWLASGLRADDPKIDRADYRQRTISKALADVTTFYDPHYHAPADVPAQPDGPAFDDDQMTTPTSAAAKQKTERKPPTKSAAYVTALADAGYSFRLNELTQYIEVNGAPLTDNLAAEIRSVMRDFTFTDMRALEDAYTRHAMRNAYHPLKEFLSGLQWDGRGHIEQLGTFLVDSHAKFANGDKVSARFLRRWLIASVGKVLDQIQAPMLVFEGRQNLGKSHFIAWLASPMRQYFVEGPISPDDKDCKIRLMSRWLWEVSELGATTRRADIESLKSFVTLRDVTVRPPYGRRDIHAPAVCSLIGTLNDTGAGFLHDTTGSRRFLTLALTDLNWGYRECVNVSQVWAEAVYLYRAGESPHLTPDERDKQAEINSEFTAVDPVEDVITSRFVIDPTRQDWRTPSIDVLTAVGDTLHGTSTGHARAIAAYFKSCGIVASRPYIGGRQVRGYCGVRPMTEVETNQMQSATRQQDT